MRDETRADRIAGNDEATVYGFRRGDEGHLIIVKPQGDQEVTVLSPRLLRGRLDAAVRETVPADLQTAVLEWIEPLRF